MQSKQCSKCKENKAISRFNKDIQKKDGLRVYCKVCQMIIQRKYRKTTKGKATRERYKQSKKCKITEKLYRQSENRKARNKIHYKRFVTQHPNQIKAVSAVNKAIKDNRLVSPKFLLCHYCPKPAQQYHHWHGYEPEHWLDVVPACLDCHHKLHRKIA